MAIKVANNNSLSAITALPAAITGGAMTLLATETASSSATISFTSNIDSTYDEYVFKFINIHPSAQSSFTLGTPALPRYSTWVSPWTPLRSKSQH